jgi:hypothetical protein
VASGALRDIRDVVVALFTGGGRLRGSAENKLQGLEVKARRARCAAVLASGRGGSRRQSGSGSRCFSVQGSSSLAMG